jgi:hypothetical protein
MLGTGIVFDDDVSRVGGLRGTEGLEAEAGDLLASNLRKLGERLLLNDRGATDGR